MQQLEAGEAAVEITPPLGIDLGGFFIPEGKDRKITAVRQPSFARALVLSAGDQQVAIVSLDLLNLSNRWSDDARKSAGQVTGIPMENIHVCVTHTHSMPGFRFVRRCGEVSPDYARDVRAKVVAAIGQAQQDLQPAELQLGQSVVVDGSYNRTAAEWKTEDQFDDRATCDDRWLDRTLHALLLRRDGRDRDLLWYQFSAHPACNNDTIAWPNWPGLVADKVRARRGLSPSLLQGHCGDVHAGPGEPRLGDPEQASDAIAAAVERALDDARPVNPLPLATGQAEIALPLDVGTLQAELRQYHANPADYTGDGWLDDAFAADWAAAARWDPGETELKTTIAALRLGEVVLLFHGSELYSYYGLKLQRASPFRATLDVGFTDGYIGYLADPQAFVNREYAVSMAPRIFDLPPYQPEAAELLTTRATQLLVELESK